MKIRLIIYLAILTGQILFLTVSLLNVYILNSNEVTGNQDLVLVFMGLLPILFAIAWFGGPRLAKKLASQPNSSGQDPLTTSYIIRLALMEAPSMLSTVAFLITLEPNFILFAVLGIALTATLRPPKAAPGA